MLDLEALDTAHEDEYLRFERVTNKRSRRPDVHAFLLLDEIVPMEHGKDSDMIAGAGHDQIYLDISSEDLATYATKDQWIELMRCGVRVDGETESLAMFV